MVRITNNAPRVSSYDLPVLDHLDMNDRGSRADELALSKKCSYFSLPRTSSMASRISSTPSQSESKIWSARGPTTSQKAGLTFVSRVTGDELQSSPTGCTNDQTSIRPDAIFRAFYSIAPTFSMFIHPPRPAPRSKTGVSLGSSHLTILSPDTLRKGVEGAIVV